MLFWSHRRGQSHAYTIQLSKLPLATWRKKGKEGEGREESRFTTLPGFLEEGGGDGRWVGLGAVGGGLLAAVAAVAYWLGFSKY